MLALSEHHHPAEIHDRLRDVGAATAELVSEVIGETHRRFPSVGDSGKMARIERLIRSEAWTDAALAAIALELPQWRLRLIVHDAGEWHCALSRQRELPEWLDQSVETHHADLALAILTAYLEVSRQPPRQPTRPSVPRVQSECLCCENFS